MKEEIKRKAKNCSETPRAIIQGATSLIDAECAVALPSYKSLVRCVERQRNGEKLNPTTLKEISIPLEMQITEKGGTISCVRFRALE